MATSPWFGEEPISELLEAAPQSGRVLDLALRDERKAPMYRVSAFDLSQSPYGFRTAKRAVTLIQAEHHGTIQAVLGSEFAWELMRRNVLVKGINLLSLLHRDFRIGEVVLHGTRLCDPCARMETLLGPGGYAAMVGLGGLCASIVETGTIRVGDELRPL
jgi:MOSC domain-containing protein YiiM